MKKIILVAMTLLSFMLNAKDINTKEISSQTTSNHYAKPGAPIDMRYTSQKVDVNESSDVNITLTTSLRDGRVSVIVDLDEHLQSIKLVDKNLSFEVTPEQQTFLINLKLKSQKEGLYYVRLLTKVNKGQGSKLRSFAIPVYVGSKTGIRKPRISPQMKALSAGENISVSKAIETVEVIK